MSVEVVERFPNLRPVQYLASLKYPDFRQFAMRWSNEAERRTLHKSIVLMCNAILKSKGQITRLYHYGLNSPDGLGGRLFGAYSIQGVPREIRGFLMKHTTDIDMKNAHPTILLYLCKKHNLITPHLEFYVNNRDVCLSQFPSREIAKELYLKAINKNKITPELKDFSKEMLQIQKSFMLFPEYSNISTTLYNKEYNREGSYLNKILCYWENRILQSAIKVIKERKLEVAVYAFDGCMVYGNHYNDSELLQSITQSVNSEFPGLNMQWDFKEHNNELQIPDGWIPQDNTNPLNVYQDKASEFNLTHTKINNSKIFIKQQDNKNIVFDKAGLLHCYENMECGVDKNGNPEYFIQKWLKDPNIPNKDNVGIYPNPSKCPSNIYNLWTPFDMELKEKYTYKQTELDFFLKHIRILCDNDEAIFNYIIKWLAHCIQFPEYKSVAVTMISKQGAGKGTLMKLITRMFGVSKILESGKPAEDVWGHFNKLMQDAFFVNLDELSKKDTLDAEGYIKMLVTGGEIKINIKGVDAFSIQSYHRFFITTNKEEPINTSKDDRRNLIIRCSDELIHLSLEENTSYFNKANQYIDDDDVVKTVYEYLKTVDVPANFKQVPVPISEYQDELKELSYSTIECWAKDFLPKTTQRTFTGKELFSEFQHWLQECNMKYDCNIIQFGVRFSRLKIDGVQKKHSKNGAKYELDLNKIRSFYPVDASET
jgi:hypothetical protein